MPDQLTDPQGERHALYLGNDHWLDWIVLEQGGPNIGATIYHKPPPGVKGIVGDGSMCAGAVWWDSSVLTDNRPVWTITGAADEHITLSPSVLCRCCGDHGFLRNGKWDCA